MKNLLFINVPESKSKIHNCWIYIKINPKDSGKDWLEVVPETDSNVLSKLNLVATNKIAFASVKDNKLEKFSEKTIPTEKVNAIKAMHSKVKGEVTGKI